MFHLLIATTNPGKISEIRESLKSCYIKISSLADFPELANISVEETGSTFAENALLKARTYGRLTGLVTLADDSGLSVDALNGAPGVLSARFAPTDAQRIAKVLDALKDYPPSKRSARFTCALVLYDPSSDKSITKHGVVEGHITTVALGTNGFGYDPIFFCPQLNMTFGQATSQQKNQVSHRHQALEQMKKIIAKRCR